jgi:feruloyl esterase
VYPGFLYDTGITAAGQRQIPGLLNPGASPVGPPNTATEMDVDAAAARVAADQMARLTDSTWVNLSTFANRGGKLIFYHGISDPWFSSLDTQGYYEQMARANGGRTRVEAWSRLYLLPGMGHCGGGRAALDRFDLLTPLVRWVEQGSLPEPVIATGEAFPGRSRPLCAFPKYAHYKGQGDPEKAENYECRE